MKSMNYIIKLAIAFVGFVLFFGCETREEIKQPVACFSYSPLTEIKAGDVVSFSNCSTDAENLFVGF